MDSDELTSALHKLLDDKKGQEIACIDLRGRSGFADFFLVVTGTSTTHVASLANEVDRYASERRLPVLGIEGMALAQWVLIDLGDILVHIFQRETRAFYNLEKLWSLETFQPEERSRRGLQAETAH